MAHASGLATDNLIAGSFFDKKSGVSYRIYQEDGKVWLSFDRPGDPLVHGKRQLLDYIGQGRRGRTYLFSVDGFVFESPVNWYTDRHLWDMAPGYQNAVEAPMNLPAVMSCLDCHVSGIRPPVEGTENRYRSPLFSQAGVSCERCHGPGSAHVNGGAIVNPAKLAPARRDAICMQCHLEGNAAIERPGKHLYEFRPGDDLSDYVRYYVLEGPSAAGLGANSQFEALAQSMCKKKAGEAMSCTSCHDPHRSPSPEERVAFYRGKCLACHGEAFGEKHHANQPDCTKCHMPANPSTDIAHTDVTDHRIPSRPTTRTAAGNCTREFPAVASAARPLPLLSVCGDRCARQGPCLGNPCRVRRSRRPPSRLNNSCAKPWPSRPTTRRCCQPSVTLSRRTDISTMSLELYQRALARDPNLIDAATNLGVLEAKTGHMREAVALWEDAFRREPGKSSVGMNLARAFCSAGQIDQARDFTLRVLEFNPDLTSAKHLLHEMNESPPKCGI